jgi:hypothetical protein
MDVKRNSTIHQLGIDLLERSAHAFYKARRKHLAGLKGLTVEERLVRIEAELYDTAANRRIGALEALNHRYA